MNKIYAQTNQYYKQSCGGHKRIIWKKKKLWNYKVGSNVIEKSRKTSQKWWYGDRCKNIGGKSLGGEWKEAWRYSVNKITECERSRPGLVKKVKVIQEELERRQL